MTKDAPDKSQIDKFRDAARQIGTDDDPERFKDVVRRLAKAKPAQTKKQKGQKPASKGE